MKTNLLTRLTRKIFSVVALLVLLFPLSASLFPIHAANLAQSIMRLDRMTASAADNQILVAFETGTTATETAIRIDFATGYDVDTTASNIHLSIDNIPTTIQGTALTACPGVASSDAADAVSGQLVTVNITDLTPGTLYGFYITAGIDNPGSATQYINTITLEQGATDDTAKIATRIISDDQVDITATVPPTFSFVLGANTTSFATDLDPSAVKSATGVTVTVGTNAVNGWITWLKSANQGLDSVTTSESIDTVISGSCTEITGAGDFYQLDVNVTSAGTGEGTITVNSGYDCTNGTHGGTFTAAFSEIATSDGTADSQIITLVALAKPSAIRAAAADYTDTWTVVGAANF